MRSLLLVLAALSAAALPLRGSPQLGRSDDDPQRPARTAVRPCVAHCGDFSQFSAVPGTSEISVDNIDRLQRLWRVPMLETVEGSPLFVERVATPRGVRNLLIVSTSTGRLVALDATSGAQTWSTTPPEGPRWTTSSPALDPGRTRVYVYGLDGAIHKHSVSTGAEIVGRGWPQLVTLKGDVEKGSSAISIATTPNGHHFLYMTTAGYPEPGDEGDYQGHLVSINLETGAQRVFNSACSDKDQHFAENGGRADDCPVVQGGIWARAGAVYVPETNRVYITTGNGVFDAGQGGFNWASSVVALAPDGSSDGGTPLDSYTPSNYQELNDQDLDLSSTTVAPLLRSSASTVPPLAVQGGKDGKLRLLDLSNLSGQGGPRHTGGELQSFSLPQSGWIITRPAVWLDGDRSFVAVTNDQGVSTFALEEGDGPPHLTVSWSNRIGCQSPVYSNGLLFCAQSGRLSAFNARTGDQVWSDPSVDGIHWQSPIVAGNRVFLADSTGITAYMLR